MPEGRRGRASLPAPFGTLGHQDGVLAQQRRQQAAGEVVADEVLGLDHQELVDQLRIGQHQGVGQGAPIALLARRLVEGPGEGLHGVALQRAGVGADRRLERDEIRVGQHHAAPISFRHHIAWDGRSGTIGCGGRRPLRSFAGGVKIDVWRWRFDGRLQSTCEQLRLATASRPVAGVAEQAKGQQRAQACAQHRPSHRIASPRPDRAKLTQLGRAQTAFTDQA